MNTNETTQYDTAFSDKLEEVDTQDQATFSFSKEVKKKKGGTKLAKFTDSDMKQFGWTTFREFMTALADVESDVYSKAVTTFKSIAPNIVGITAYYNKIDRDRRQYANEYVWQLASHLRFQGKSEPIFATKTKNGNRRGDQIGFSAYLKASLPKVNAGRLTDNICSIKLDLPNR